MKKFTFKKINENYYQIRAISGYSLFCSRNNQNRLWTVRTVYGETLAYPSNATRICEVEKSLEKYCA